MGDHGHIGTGMDEPGQMGWRACGLCSEYRFVLNMIAIARFKAESTVIKFLSFESYF